MVLRNAGPIGAPGMPEAGALPIPKKLGHKGVTDMVRISDARMSGTAFGTVVLHVTPEASAGGPLALVRDGDRIRSTPTARRIDLLVDDAELAPPPRHLEAARKARARLRPALCRARDPGRQRLRFRLLGGDLIFGGRLVPIDCHGLTRRDAGRQADRDLGGRLRRRGDFRERPVLFRRHARRRETHRGRPRPAHHDVPAVP